MNLSASKTPAQDIQNLTFEGQPEWRRQYQTGYEDYFNDLRVITPDTPVTKLQIDLNKQTMSSLAAKLKRDATVDPDSWILKSQRLADSNQFVRTILALESPTIKSGDGGDHYVAGHEVVTGNWKKGMEIPVHGHPAGFMHEEMIYGKAVVSYYLRQGIGRTVRQIRSEMIEGSGLINSAYTKPQDADDYSSVIHKFRFLEDSFTLHYFPSHTRDARGTTFEVEWFEDYYDVELMKLQQINTYEALRLKAGDVLAVRSENDTDFGDHYLVAHGYNEMTKLGLRPKVSVITAKDGYNPVLDNKTPTHGAILLKLGEIDRQCFLMFHGISVTNREVSFPKI